MKQIYLLKTSEIIQKKVERYLFSTFFILILAFGTLNAQVLIDPAGGGGFENTTTTFAANGWLESQPGIARQWRVGTVAGSVAGGTKAAYVGAAANYNGTATGTVMHFYKDVTIPAGSTNVSFSFSIRQPTVDDTFDFLRVFTTTTANTPVAGTNPGAGYTQLFENTATVYSAFTAIPAFNLTALSGTTVRIVFTFVSDGVSPNANPAIDNVSLTYTPGVSCSGTPNAGVAQSSLSSVCISTSFTLSLNGATSTPGISYQWQSSPDNSNWTNITGATGPTFATTQASSTYYRSVVTCSGNNANSSSVQVLTEPFYNCYCTPSYANSCEFDWISNVTFGSINNTTICSGTTPTNLTTYNSPNPSFSQTVGYPLSVTTDGDIEGFNVWIDYNHNGIFDAAESVLSALATTAPSTTTGTITIPNTALLGTTKMRVRCRYNTAMAATGACTALNGALTGYGEAEDYLITITPPPACFPPTAQTATNITSSSATIPFTCNTCVGPYIVEYGISPFTTPGTGSTAGVGGTILNVSSSPAILNGLSSNISYTVYIRQDCSVSSNGYSSNSNPINFTTACQCAVLPFTEGFNSTSIPVCWSQQFITGADPILFNATSTNPVTNPQEGSNFVFYNAFSYTSGNETRLVSSPVATIGALAAGVNFYWYNENSTLYNTGSYLNEGVTIQYSLDGTNWVDVQFFPRQDATLTSGSGQWNLKSLILPNAISNQSLVYLGLKFHSSFGDNCSLDNLNIVALTPCNGSPSASGTISNTANPICNGNIFTLSLTADYSAIPGISYQWQSAPDLNGVPGTFANVASNGNSSTYSTSQTSVTWYQCLITCVNTAQTVISTAYLATTQLCYCIPVYATGCAADQITNFSFNTLVNNSGTSCNTSPPGYSIFGTVPTNLTTAIAPGQTYIATVTVATGNANGTGVAIWIDFNNNGLFEPSENFNNGATKFASNTTGTLSVTIPSGLANGQYRMRVRSMRNTLSDAISPCLAGNANGEAEDYTITIATCSGTPDPGNTQSSANGICPASAFTLSLQNPQSPVGISYQWQSAPSSSGPWTNVGPDSPTWLTSQPETQWYQCLVSCTISGLSTTSNPLEVITTPLPSPKILPGDTILCFPDTVALYVVDTGAYSAGYPAGTTIDWIGIVNGLSPTQSISSNNGLEYIVKVNLPNGCFAYSDTVFVLTRSVTIIPNIYPASCGIADGKIVANISTGITPFHYVWTDGNLTLRDTISSELSDSLTSLMPGTYYLTVFDNFGNLLSCNSGNVPFVVSGNNGLIAAIESSTNLSCFNSGDGSASVIVQSGGTGNFTYQWNSGQSTAQVFGLIAGTYTATVTDQFGCSDTAVVLITEPNPISINTIAQDITCNGGSDGTINAVISGGTSPYDIQWYDVNFVSVGSGIGIGNLNAGIYFVVVTDSNSCFEFTSDTITEPVAVVISGFTPSNGSTGTVVTINGGDFTGTTNVLFNGVSAASFTVVNSGEITAVVPSGASTGLISVVNGSCSVNSTGTFTFNSSATLNVTAIIEGYYIGGGQMTSTLLSQGIAAAANECDTITVELRDQFSPGTVVASVRTVLHVDGQAAAVFPGALSGGSYYVVVLHRNALQTWSALPVTLSGNTSYNFTTANGQSYGSNMKLVDTGIWAMYSGDIEPQDEFIDVFDQSTIDNDAGVFAFGYYSTDVNGDGFVDVFDQAIVDNNATLFIFSAHP